MRAIAAFVMGSFAVVLCGATLVAQVTSAPSAVPPREHGGSLYATYCATCHGSSARGDGPLADTMKRRPANLTEIAKRNNGVFPREIIFKVIDGREPVRGHGGPDMPVWGDAFKRSIDVGGEEAVRNRIQALVDYLETIQLRSTN